MQLNLAKRWPNWPTNNLAWWHFAILVSGIYLFFFYLFPLSLANNERIYRYAQLLTGPTFILLISALIISFLLLWSLLNSAPKISTKNALIFIAICAIPFLFVYPGDSADTFANIWYAKRVVDLGENPYVTSYVYETYQDIQTVLPPTSDSPLLPYGPLWLGFQSSIYFVTKSLSLIPMLFTFKLIQLTGVLLTAFFCTKLGSLFAKPDQANIVTTVVFASPFMLLGFVGNGHSDIWLALCLVISFYLLFKERILLGLFMFTASVLVKYISLIFAPFIILYLWHRYRRGVLNDLAVWGVFSSFVGLLFAWKLNILQGVFAQAGITSFSLVQIVDVLSSNPDDAMLVKSIMFVVFVLGYLLLLITGRFKETLDTPEKLLKTLLAITALFFLFFIHLWAYWYTVWFIPFLFALSRKHVLLFCFSSYLLICNFLWGWYVYVQFANQSISIQTMAILLSIGIGLSFIIVTARFMKDYIWPEFKRRLYLVF